jgi:antitoxin component YwqK of YwqJK toxin-antitoxin module
MRRLTVVLLAALAAAAVPALADDLDFLCPSGSALRERGLESACETRAGIGEGPFWSRREDGSLRLWGQARNDVTHGTWIKFHPGGEKAIEAEYRKGQLSGSFRQWNRDGALVYAGQHDADGEMHGTWTRWWPTGEKRVEWEMEHGRTNGPVAAWWESGRKRFRGQRVDGVDHGAWTWWDEHGDVAAECRYERGKVVEGACGGAN